MSAPRKKSKPKPTAKIQPPYRSGKNPETDAWLTAFFIENHLDFYGYPEMVASPEQVRFMVCPEDEERYYPCTDRTFDALVNRNRSAFLNDQYQRVKQRLMALIQTQIENNSEKKYLETLIQIKFEHETKDMIMIPSRIEKRLIRIFLNRTQIEDPWLDEKARRNQRADAILGSKAFKKALNQINPADFSNPAATLSEMKSRIEYLELKRLFALTVEKSLWESDRAPNYKQNKLFDKPFVGNGWRPLSEFLGIGPKPDAKAPGTGRKILWLADEAGEIIIDLAIIRYLVRLGHKIIIVFKQGPLYTKVDFSDAQGDPVLSQKLEGIYFISENNMAKNDLLNTLRSENDIFALSDGTREELNLLLASTTFARIFREVDGVISRGPAQKRRFFDTHFQFTQNIFNISQGPDDSVSIRYKPRHPSAIKFSHSDLEYKARSIVTRMEKSKKDGMTVIFYSAIIGSIPGKIQMAKKIIAVFIDFLKSRLESTFIINPSEYFEPGMDADDLMYMWEIVQKSGLIDIWRFQTYEDISRAFQIMKKKVPPEWVGKDATYSTGCTKEMKIALEVQQKHPEMQIIGPAKEKFMRRDEYGVGKMYDKRLGIIERV